MIGNDVGDLRIVCVSRRTSLVAVPLDSNAARKDVRSVGQAHGFKTAYHAFRSNETLLAVAFTTDWFLLQGWSAFLLLDAASGLLRLVALEFSLIALPLVDAVQGTSMEHATA